MNRKSIKFNMAMNVFKVVSGMIFPLITFPYTSRVIGPEGTGKVNFATSLVAYFILLASVGVPLYGIREVAKVRDDKESLSALVQELLAIHGVATLISFAVFLGLIVFNHKLRMESLLFLIVSASIPLSMLTMEWLYQGLEDYIYITVRSMVFSTISLVALFLFVHGQGDYWINAAISVVSSLGSSILNFYNARKIIFVRRSRDWELKRHLNPLFKGYLLNFIISIYINLDTVMLGFLSAASNVGYYSSAMKLTKLLLTLVSSFGSVLIPRLSYITSNELWGEFDRILKKSLSVTALLCIPASAALMFMSREIILLFGGKQYLPAAPCIVITAPIILVIGLNSIFGYQILYTRGKERMFIVSVTAGAVINVCLNALLIPRLAHVGAAWGATIAETAILLIEIACVRLFYQVQWPLRCIVKYVVAATVMVCTIILVHIVVPEENLWLRLCLDVPLGTLVYFGLLLLMREEISAEALLTIRKLVIQKISL